MAVLLDFTSQTVVRLMLTVNYARPYSPARLGVQQTYFTTLAALTLWGTAVSKKRPTTSANATPQKQQQTTMERYSASVPYDKDSKRYRDITQGVAYHIAKDMLAEPSGQAFRDHFENIF